MGKIFKALEKSGRSNEEEQSKSNEIEKIAEIKEPLHQTTKIHQNNFAADESINPISFTLDNNLVTALKPNSVISEQFRNLKNSILFPEKGNPPKTIMVTSTSPSEGKSFISSNLAVSIAQNIDEYVLLIDCDLRSPSIYSMFGMDYVDGLSEYLSKGKPIESLIQNTFLNKLKILTAGHIPDNPSELLSSEQMRRLLHEVKLRYSDRYIIIDTPPPYVTSETSALSRSVDGVILVVRQGIALKQNLHDIIDIYGREKILGVVFNDAKKPLGYGYGRYGYGKYGYGKYGTPQK